MGQQSGTGGVGGVRGKRSLSVSLPLYVREATVHRRPRPPPTATPLLCRRSMLVLLGRPLKRDSVTFRWNALGAHDSAEEEQRLREAEREKEREEEKSVYFMQNTSWSNTEKRNLSGPPGEDSSQCVRWHQGEANARQLPWTEAEPHPNQSNSLCATRGSKQHANRCRLNSAG